MNAKNYIFPSQVSWYCRKQGRWLRKLFRSNAVDSLSGDVIVECLKEAWMTAERNIACQKQKHTSQLMREEAKAKALLQKYMVQERNLETEIRQLEDQFNKEMTEYGV